MSDEKTEYSDFAQDVIEKYYRNKDLDENNDLSALVSENVLKLLNAKISMERFQRRPWIFITRITKSK